ncbi:MAG: hypothetical protein SOZ99_06020, partial [Paraeggerthella sp.]|nr:hypothetical protein [Paraeggerthella sp.]
MEPNEGQHAARNARPRHSIGRTIASVLLWALAACIVVGMASRYAPSVLSNGRLIPEVAAFVPWFAIPSVAVLLVAAF